MRARIPLALLAALGPLAVADPPAELYAGTLRIDPVHVRAPRRSADRRSRWAIRTFRHLWYLRAKK